MFMISLLQSIQTLTQSLIVGHIDKKIVFTFITPLHTLNEVELHDYEWPNFCPEYKKL